MNAPNVEISEFKMEGYLTKYYNNIFKPDYVRYYILDFQNGNLRIYRNKPTKKQESQNFNFREI